MSTQENGRPDRVTWRGKSYEVVDDDRLSWAEVDRLENAAGATLSEMRDPAVRSGMRATAAFFWVSIMREDPSVTWGEFFGSPMKELVFEAGEQQAGAAAEPEPAAPEPVTPAPEAGPPTVAAPAELAGIFGVPSEARAG